FPLSQYAGRGGGAGFLLALLVSPAPCPRVHPHPDPPDPLPVYRTRENRTALFDTNPKPPADFQAALAADLELAANIGPVLVMDALSCRPVPPDAGQPLCLALGFLRLGRQHLWQQLARNKIDVVQKRGRAHFRPTDAAPLARGDRED